MRISVTPVSRSPARMAAGIGAAAVARQQRRVEVERPVAEVEQRSRHDLAVVGEDHALGSRASRAANDGWITQPGGREDRQSEVPATSAIGVERCSRPGRPAVR